MGKRGRVQTNVEYVIARFLVSGLGLLRRPLAVRVGLFLGRLGYLFAGNLKNTATRNLELAFPDMSERQRRSIVRGCFLSLGRQLGEFSQISNMNPEGLRQVVVGEGLEHLDAARARGRGVIVFTGHMGAWELSSLALSCFGYPLNVIARRLDNPKVEKLVDRIRTRFGNRTFDKRASMRPIWRVLKAGEMLGTLVDTNMLADEGIFVKFFGIPASTSFMMAKLALHTGAMVVPGFAVWEEQYQHFVLRIGPPLSAQVTGDEVEDIRQLTSQATERLEEIIRRYPDQWLWIHKRWRTRPDGEPDLYASLINK